MTTESLPSPLVLFDGECGFCDASVQWLLDHDRAGALHFAPLQGPTAAAVLARHPELPAGLDSLVLVEQGTTGERVFFNSGAPLRIAAMLPWPWRVGSWLAVLPRGLTDWGYRQIARRRHLLAGKPASCRLPSPDQRARLLP